MVNLSMIENPFVLSGYISPDYFCDRESETENLVSALRNGRNVTLRSPRRIGKTGLIHNAFHRLREANPEVACFYVDIFSTKSLQDFVAELAKAILGQLDTPWQKAEGVLSQLLRSAHLTLSSDPVTGSPQVGLSFQPEQTRATLSELFSYMRHSGRECFVAIDEFQQIAEYPEGGVEALLRAEVQQCANVHFIFSGSRLHLMDSIFTSPKRPFFRSTEKLSLDILPEPVYYAFAAKWLKKVRSTLSEEVFHELYSRVDGVTWYVQYLLNRLYQLRPSEIKAEDVSAALETIVRGEADDYRKFYSLLTLNQSQVLRAVAKEHRVTSLTSKELLRRYNLPAASSVQRAADFLMDKEYIYRADDGYLVYDRFFALWLQQLP